MIQTCIKQREFPFKLCEYGHMLFHVKLICCVSLNYFLKITLNGLMMEAVSQFLLWGSFLCHKRQYIYILYNINRKYKIRFLQITEPRPCISGIRGSLRVAQAQPMRPTALSSSVSSPFLLKIIVYWLSAAALSAMGGESDT